MLPLVAINVASPGGAWQSHSALPANSFEIASSLRSSQLKLKPVIARSEATWRSINSTRR